MPQRPPRLSDVFHTETFKRATVTQPILRLYRVPSHKLTEVPLSGSGLRPGDRLVLAIDPQHLADRTEQELLNALHSVVKNLRRMRGVKAKPSAEDLEVYRLKGLGFTYPEIVAKLELRVEPSHLARQFGRAKKWLASCEERELAALSPRHRAIQKIARDLAKREDAAEVAARKLAMRKTRTAARLARAK